jgi:aconitate hydratase/homoaconitate hydratase
MTAELGGLNGIFPADARTRQTMAARRSPEHRDGGWWFRADEDARYAATFCIDLEGLAPQVAKPYSPDNVCDVDEVSGEALDGCFIGACTTTEEELVLAGLVLERAMAAGRRPVASERRLLVPGSLEITGRLEAAGLLDTYRRAGFRVGEPGCSMCIGMASDRAQPGETWLSSQNRNFPNRMGPGSIAWLSSAVTVAASAFDLRITDPRPLVAQLDRERAARLLAPRSGLPPVVHGEPEPQDGGERTAGGSAAAVRARPVVRGRAQLFGDHVDTDAMIAAEFCHHSDPAELGPKAFLHFRPDFVVRVRSGEDIVVAGEGWGTGSSREQAVWALRGAGVRTVIARSVAYIHKRNLVNEALPFLIVQDPEFHRTVRDGDELEVDPGAGTVKLHGSTYQGTLPAQAMNEIIESGGLVSRMRESLESRQF